MWRYLRNLTLALLTFLLVAGPLTACGEPEREADDLSARPAAVTMPSGRVCHPWVNNPNESRIDGDDGIPPCDYPIPTDRPVQHDGMSPLEFVGLMYLFNVGMGHSDFYFGPAYYGHYIGPAWNRYPGSYYGYGHTPITRVDQRTYNTTIINNVNTKYAADIKRDRADPKYSTYKTAGGKTYTGATVPKTAFRSTNVPVTGPAGDGGGTKSRTSTGTGTKSSTSGGKSSTSTGSSGGKSGWSGSSGSSSRSSGSSSSSSRSGK
jgi:hypothetical protein